MARRVIVCGGRDYSDKAAIYRALDGLESDAVIVHGGARGADRLAGEVAALQGRWQESFPANWAEHGKSAGPRRNIAMLEAGADLVIAFPGGKGTAHMVKIARQAGVPVVEVVLS
jgi:hypothetical protein